MRRPVIALALFSAAPLVAAIGGTGFPHDEVIVRDCYGAVEDDLNSALQQQFGQVGSGTSAGGTVATAPTTPPPPASPAPVEEEELLRVVASKDKGKSGGKKPSAKKPKPAKDKGGGLFGSPKASNSAATPPMDEAPAPEPEPEAVAGGDLADLPVGRSYDSTVQLDSETTGSSDTARDRRSRHEDPDDDGIVVEGRVEEAERVAADAMRRAEEERKRAEEAYRAAEEARKQAEEAQRRAAQLARQPVLDWGAKIFLSNDDSMSLASAQRVIYALKRGVLLSTDQIRPHELLNYFSFDVAEPSTEQLFDVHASATTEGDRMAVALAVKGASPEPEPLDLTLVVDRSCSMEDEGRMDYTRRGLRRMQDQLKRGDRVDLVLFDDTVCTPVENFVVGRDDPAILSSAIDRIVPDGATDLDLGLREGYRVAAGHVDTHRRNRRVMVLTDAELNRGDVDPNTVTEIGRHFDDAKIRLTGIGVGRTFRDDVLDRLTEKGKGAYVFLGSEAVVDRVFGTGFPSLVQTIAHDVQFELDLPESLAMERFYGEEASTVAADVQPINYYAGTSQVFLQDLALRPGRLDPSDPITLTIRYREADSGEPAKRVFRTTLGTMMDSDPHNVDKARALMAWTDMLTTGSMGADPCGAELHTYADRARKLSDDAEIAFVNGLVKNLCGELPLPTTVAAAPLKVKVDSDQPISHVALACPGVEASQALSGSDTIARFDAAPGMCTVTLGGVVDLRVEVEVPDTGRDLRCTVRGGRVHCG